MIMYDVEMLKYTNADAESIPHDAGVEENQIGGWRIEGHGNSEGITHGVR